MCALKTTKIGLIGLGLMGKPMARNLKKSGANVTVFNRSLPALKEMEAEGFAIAHSPAEVAAKVDMIICMVSDTPAVESVLLGDSGVIHGIRDGSIVIPTWEPLKFRQPGRFAKIFNQKSVGYVDAPVSGGEIGAIDGTLSIMVGASESDMEQVKPVLNALGKNVTHIGEIGCGQIAKAANQIIVGLTIGAISEAFALAQHGGANLDQVWKALSGGFASSRILEVHGRRMIEDNFRPGGTAKTQKKDLNQALDFALAIGIDLPSTQLCHGLYDKLVQCGDGGLDHSALFKLYSK